MNDLRFMVGKAFQLAGLIMVLWVILLFFGETSMGELLEHSLAGIGVFYLGTFIAGGRTS